ncbi:MAG: acylneuraminate cytidylyltransferase family protein [Thermodesulfovibrionales bacterium]|nr:acylneuraminate cytidylyltransferase family protein [Thermodesulfovibrionales bacterium]
MNILCVIPARGGSKRTPGKNIKPLMGKPLISYTIEKALESRLVTRVVVSTDSPDIARVARDFGAEVVERPANISEDTSAIDDSLRHAVRHLEAGEGFRPDVVVLLQANVPVRKEGEIDEVIRALLENPEAESVATVYEVDQRIEWMKRVDASGKVTPFMGQTASYRKQDLPELYLIDGAIEAVRTDTLMRTEGNRMAHAYFGERLYAFIHEKKYAIEVDVAEDLEMAEYFLGREHVPLRRGKKTSA